MLQSPAAVHKDTYLTNLSVGYRNKMYIGDMVFPNVTVTKVSDYYYKFLKGAWFRDEARVRGPGGEAAQGDYPSTAELYKCQERAFKSKVPIELINNADAPIRPFESKTRFVTDKILLSKEIAVAAQVMDANNWTTTDDAAGAWVATADGTGNTFIADIEAQKEVIRGLLGVYPNRLLMDAKTFKEVKNEFSVLERIRYTGSADEPAAVTTRTLAELFELDMVLIGGAIKSTAKEVLDGSDFTSADIWEVNATKGSALLYYQTPDPAIEEPSAGYVFNWTGAEDPESSEIEADLYRHVRYWWEKAIKSYWVEASESFDAQVCCPDAGCLFTDTIVT